MLPQLLTGSSATEQTILPATGLTEAPVNETHGTEGLLFQEVASEPPVDHFTDTQHREASDHARSDFASYGSIDQDRRSIGRDHSFFNQDGEDRTRGRSRYVYGRRNSSATHGHNSRHQPEVVIRSRPLTRHASHAPVLPHPHARTHRSEGFSIPPPATLIIPPLTRSPSPRRGTHRQQGPPITIIPLQRHTTRDGHAYVEQRHTPPSLDTSRRRFSSRSSSRHRLSSRSPSYPRHSYRPNRFHSGTIHDTNAYPSYGNPAYPYPTVQPAPVIIIPPARPEPPYVAVNPFSLNPPQQDSPTLHYTAPPSLSSASSSVSSPAHTSPSGSGHSDHRAGRHASRPDYPPILPSPVSSTPRRPTRRKRFKQLFLFIGAFVFIRIPRQLYLLLLLRLPSLYFSRVSRLFEDANLSLPDIRRMAVANADQWKDGTPGSLMTAWMPNDATVSPHLLNFRHSWEGFIDSLLREWKTQNVVSALMLSAILTMLQIDAAASDPIARTTALLSLISALMSLLFGSMYIIRFGTMRKMYKAASWADEAQKGRTSILWNVWILLAIPAVWLAWSIILFVTCIMAFVWRTGAVEDPVDTALSHNTAHGLRIGVSAVLAVALAYLFLIVKTFRKYGDVMDKKWNEKVYSWAREGRYAQIGVHSGAWRSSLSLSRSRSRTRRRSRSLISSSPRDRQYAPPMHSSRSIPGISPTDGRRSFPHERNRDIPPATPTRADSFGRLFVPDGELVPFPAIKVMDLRYRSSRTCPLPTLLQDRDILLADWLRFTGELEDTWNGFDSGIPPFPIDSTGVVGTRERAAGLMHLWNRMFFLPRATQAVLCREQPNVGLPGYAVYLMHLAPDTTFGPLPDGLQRITVIHFLEPPNEGPSSVQYDIGPAVPINRASPPQQEARDPVASSGSLACSIPLPPSPSPVSGPILAPSPVRPIVTNTSVLPGIPTVASDGRLHISPVP
ncbi:hypothetical protein DFH09DRAFT_1178377 [Mycena vulgaris]|nr:hypothetical protein DFH09DRAFT_1178377 [Mycena vulgaris]